MIKRRTVFVFFTLMLLLGIVSSLETNAESVDEAIYIRADGSIDPTGFPISTLDNITYTLTGNIGNGIVIERDNIAVDGMGFSLEGETSYGVYVNSIRNVSIKNMRIAHFGTGIFLNHCSNNSLSTTRISASYYGIFLVCSSGNNISDSDIVASGYTGIHCMIDPSQEEPAYCNHNRIIGNNITGTHDIDGGAVHIDGFYNIICGNNITNSYIGIVVEFPSRYNAIFHNNFINNTLQAVYTTDLATTWDVESEGNYWSDYTGTDANQDGIGDTPYVIYESNVDHYPLTSPYVIPEFPTFMFLPLVMVGTILLMIACKRKHLLRAL